jgi:1-acyl-sn-glycerol-3-phosphate acyltransferase
MMLINILYLPWTWIKLCYHASHVDKYTDEAHNLFLKDIVKHANKGGRITVDAHGVENIPKENGFILFPNHQGMYDVLAILDACPNPISVVAKQEVAQVQGLKQVFACMKALFIDRNDLKQSMKVIQQVTAEVKQGRNYVIFAEGTRSRQQNQVLDFKGGSFKSAVKARCPIVPVALIDAYKGFDTNSIKPITVQIHFLPPMEYEEYKELKTTEIAEVVKNRIQATIAANE